MHECPRIRRIKIAGSSGRIVSLGLLQADKQTKLIKHGGEQNGDWK